MTTTTTKARACHAHTTVRGVRGEWRVTVNGVLRCIALDALRGEWYVTSGPNRGLALGPTRRAAVRRLLTLREQEIA